MIFINKLQQKGIEGFAYRVLWLGRTASAIFFGATSMHCKNLRKQKVSVLECKNFLLLSLIHNSLIFSLIKLCYNKLNKNKRGDYHA